MARGSGALGGLLLGLLVVRRLLSVFCVKGNCITLLHRVIVYYGCGALICEVGPMAGGTFCVVGAMVIDGEDAGATIIAVVARRLLISPCPGFAMGVRTMAVVTVQGASRGYSFWFILIDLIYYVLRSFSIGVGCLARVSAPTHFNSFKVATQVAPASGLSLSRP